jgi:antagonist of KipI
VTVSGEVEFLRQTPFAIAGGDLSAALSGAPVENWTATVAVPGDRLAFVSRRQGARAYLAVAGGILVPEVLGSRSTDLESRIGGVSGRPLRAGDELEAGPHGRFVPRTAPLEFRSVYREPFVLRFLPAASPLLYETLALFAASTFRVSAKISRMGYRLEGPALPGPLLGEMLSEPIPPGTIQLPAEGSPILLMADRQTVGGYPRLGSVIAADTPRAAQLFTGHPVRFVPVSLASAHAALREQETLLARITA